MRSTTAAGLLVVLAGLAGGARTVRAEDGGGKPWFPMLDPRRGPEETYDLNSLAVIRAGDDGWRVNRGKYRESVSRHDFFVTVGRHDLAAREISSRATSFAFIWCGAAAAIVGTWMLYAHFSPGGLDPSPDWGLVLIGAGAVSAFVGSEISGPSLNPDEVDGMTRRYNEQLKAHIEDESGEQKIAPLQAAMPRLTPRRSPTLVPILAPFAAGRSGMGLVALARF